jgi:hypothetical protein
MKTILYNYDLNAYIENNKKIIIETLKENEKPITENNMFETAYYLSEDEYNLLISCIKEYDNKNNYDYILVCGCLGLWYGSKIIKARLTSLKNAFEKCACYDSNMVYFTNKNSTLNIDSYHHDGCNSFKIYRVYKGKKYAIKLIDLLACY